MANQVIQGASAVTQWGIGFANACGEAALAVVRGILSGTPPQPSDVAALVRAGIPFGVDPTGTSTPAELTKLAGSQGITLHQGGGGAAALSTINANLAAGEPTILEVMNARAFGGSDSTVFGHYVTIIGQDASGNYITADSNQPAALKGQAVTYTPSQILAANPFATLTPTSIRPPGWGLTPGGAVAGAAAGVPWLSGLLGGIGAKSAPDLFWRTGLIIGGMVLIVLGIMIFFQHQEQETVEVVGGQVGEAAKGAATAAVAA